MAENLKKCGDCSCVEKRNYLRMDSEEESRKLSKHDKIVSKTNETIQESFVSSYSWNENTTWLIHFLIPIATFAFIWKRREILMKFLIQLDRTKLLSFYSTVSKQDRLMKWVSERIIFTGNIQEFWKDGAIMCTLINSAIPGACNNPHRHWKKPPTHGQALAYKYLNIAPIFTDSELSETNLVPNLERKLVEYLTLVQQAISKTTSADTEDLKFSSNYVARGMGLITGDQRRKNTFFIYPNGKFVKPECILINIKGPYSTFGSATIKSLKRKSPHDSDEKQKKLTFFKAISLDFASLVTGKEANEKKIPIEICLEENRARVTYIPQESGVYEICLITNGSHLIGSPCTIQIQENTSGMEEDFHNNNKKQTRNVLIKRRVVSKVIDCVNEIIPCNDHNSYKKISESGNRSPRNTDTIEHYSSLSSNESSFGNRENSSIQIDIYNQKTDDNSKDSLSDIEETINIHKTIDVSSENDMNSNLSEIFEEKFEETEIEKNICPKQEDNKTCFQKPLDESSDIFNELEEFNIENENKKNMHVQNGYDESPETNKENKIGSNSYQENSHFPLESERHICKEKEENICKPKVSEEIPILKENLEYQKESKEEYNIQKQQKHETLDLNYQKKYPKDLASQNENKKLCEKTENLQNIFLKTHNIHELSNSKQLEKSEDDNRKILEEFQICQAGDAIPKKPELTENISQNPEHIEDEFPVVSELSLNFQKIYEDTFFNKCGMGEGTGKKNSDEALKITLQVNKTSKESSNQLKQQNDSNFQKSEKLFDVVNESVEDKFHKEIFDNEIFHCLEINNNEKSSLNVPNKLIFLEKESKKSSAYLWHNQNEPNGTNKTEETTSPICSNHIEKEDSSSNDCAEKRKNFRRSYCFDRSEESNQNFSSCSSFEEHDLRILSVLECLRHEERETDVSLSLPNLTETEKLSFRSRSASLDLNEILSIKIAYKERKAFWKKMLSEELETPSPIRKKILEKPKDFTSRATESNASSKELYNVVFPTVKERIAVLLRTNKNERKSHKTKSALDDTKQESSKTTHPMNHIEKMKASFEKARKFFKGLEKKQQGKK